MVCVGSKIQISEDEWGPGKWHGRWIEELRDAGGG